MGTDFKMPCSFTETPAGKPPRYDTTDGRVRANRREWILSLRPFVGVDACRQLNKVTRKMISQMARQQSLHPGNT